MGDHYKSWPADPEAEKHPSPEGHPNLGNKHQKGKPHPDVARSGGRSRQTASRLKEIRLSLGLTQIQLAAAAGTNLEVIRKAERGYLLQLRTSTILRLSTALECGASDIFPIFRERLNTL